MWRIVLILLHKPCLEILLCFVFLLFFIWVCPVTMHCEQWGWTDHCFARQHFDSYFKNCFLWKFPCFELKRCSRLPWSESISSFDLNVASAAAARDKCGVFENFFAFLSFQYDSPSSHTHTNSQISTSYVQNLCICFRGEQSQSCLYVGYGKIYFCNGTLSVLIGAFSWQRDTICIMQGSISNGPCIGSAANLSSLWDWGGGWGERLWNTGGCILGWMLAMVIRECEDGYQSTCKHVPVKNPDGLFTLFPTNHATLVCH